MTDDSIGYVTEMYFIKLVANKESLETRFGTPATCRKRPRYTRMNGYGYKHQSVTVYILSTERTSLTSVAELHDFNQGFRK